MYYCSLSNKCLQLVEKTKYIDIEYFYIGLQLLYKLATPLE